MRTTIFIDSMVRHYLSPVLPVLTAHGRPRNPHERRAHLRWYAAVGPAARIANGTARLAVVMSLLAVVGACATTQETMNEGLLTFTTNLLTAETGATLRRGGPLPQSRSLERRNR